MKFNLLTQYSNARQQLNAKKEELAFFKNSEDTLQQEYISITAKLGSDYKNQVEYTNIIEHISANLDSIINIQREIKALEKQIFNIKLKIAAIGLIVAGGSVAAAAYIYAPQIAAGASVAQAHASAAWLAAQPHLSAAQAQASAAWLATQPHLIAFGMAVYAGLAKLAAAGNLHLVQPFLAYAQVVGAKLLATAGVDPIAHATAATVTGVAGFTAVTGGVYAGYKAAKAVKNTVSNGVDAYITATLARFVM